MENFPGLTTDHSHEVVAFRVGPQEFCVDIMSVREIRGWTAPTPLPHAPAHVSGVINLRGVVLPVVDMAARIGLQSAEPTSRHVIIVVSIAGQLVGLQVDSVCDILDIPPEDLQPTPEVAGGPLQALVTALVSMEDRMIGVLSLDQLLPPAAAAAA